MSIIPDSLNPFAPSEEAKVSYETIKRAWKGLEAWGVKDKLPNVKAQLEFWQNFSMRWDHDDRDIPALNAAAEDVNVVLRYAREKGYWAKRSAPTTHREVWERWEEWARSKAQLGDAYLDGAGMDAYLQFSKEVGGDVAKGAEFPPPEEAMKKYGPVSRWAKPLLDAEERLSNHVTGDARGVDIEAASGALKAAAQVDSAVKAAEGELRAKLAEIEKAPAGLIARHGGKIALGVLVFGGVYALSRWPGQMRR